MKKCFAENLEEETRKNTDFCKDTVFRFQSTSQVLITPS